MKITYLGHACLAIEIEGKHLLVDPFITGNELAKDIDVNALKADYILITHAHQDHVLDVESIAERTGAIIISNYEIVTHYEKSGFRGHPMNHGGTYSFDFGKLTYTNAIHSSSFADGSYGGQPGGFVIKTNDCSVYIAGDSALTYDMKIIPKIAKIDLAILPIGDNFTMGIEGATLAAEFVKCRKILGVHYDTFDLIKINHHYAKEYFKIKGLELVLLPIGDYVMV